MNKSISIIVPAYNCQNTIKRCVESIINQSMDCIDEIIIVDDGSRDKTSEIVKKLQISDGRIIYLYKSNNGVSCARNYGINHAHGELLMFVDSDDELKIDLLERMLTANDQSDLVVAGIELHQDHGLSSIAQSGQYMAIDLIHKYGNYVPALLLNGPCSKLFKNAIVKKYQIKFDEKISLGEDTLFVFEYLKYCQQISFVDYPGYVYYQLGNSSLMTKLRPDAYDNAKIVYKRLLDESKEICAGVIPENMISVYCNILTNYLRKMVIDRKKLPRAAIKRCISDYINDEIVHIYFGNRKKNSNRYTQKLWRSMIQHHWVGLMEKYLLFQLMIHENKNKLNNKSGEN